MSETASRICVIVPTYNNAATLREVLDRILAVHRPVIVVNDGSTDATADILAGFGNSVEVVTHAVNRGKGAALVSGFHHAAACGYTHAITIDSDGQHFPEDIPAVLQAHAANPAAIVVGQRDIEARNMPGKNTFTNKFSNFWFYIQTGVKLRDTQTGFRLYPLQQLRGLRCITSRYEAELELMVYASWHGTRIVSVPIRVHYPPAGVRVSHFRPGRDFARISVLNTVLCFFTVVYAWPLRGARAVRRLFGGNGRSRSSKLHTGNAI